MSLTICDSPEEKETFRIQWKNDWDYWMIREFMESNFGAISEYAKSYFTLANLHRPYLSSHLGEINQKIARETLQYLGRQPKALPSKVFPHAATEEDLQRVIKTNPYFHRFRNSPFCWCFYNGTQSLACKFCRFACCASANRQEMHDPVVSCPKHGMSRLEEDFSI